VTTAYLDSSAAVKLFLEDEADAEALQELLVGVAAIVTNRLTYVETLASLAAARRAGRLSAQHHEAAVDAFERLWLEWDILELTPELAQEAGSVAETFGLRAGDAVQLATARRLNDAPLVMLAWDTRLRVAAMAAGLICHPPTI
jgi:uncharacterized protein